MAEYIRNNKLLVFIISILLLSNIALLFFFLKGNSGKQGSRDMGKRNISPTQFMIETLRDSVGFNEEQIARYSELSKKHKETIKPLFEEIKHTKDSLYKMLMTPGIPDSTVNSFLNKIGEDQRNIDEKIFMHFRTLRELCADDQKAKFDSVTQRIIKRMIAGPSKRGSSDKDKKK